MWVRAFLVQRVSAVNPASRPVLSGPAAINPVSEDAEARTVRVVPVDRMDPAAGATAASARLAAVA